MRLPRRRSVLLSLVALVCLASLVVTVVVIRSGGTRTAGTPTSSGAGTQGAEAGDSCGGQQLKAPRQLRGMWLTTVYNIDFPSKPGLDEATVKAEYLGWHDLAQRLGFNAIFVHIRPSGDAFWPSTYAPWSEWLTGKRDGVGPGWDPLAFMVEQAHARNLEFQGWFNPYRGGQPTPLGAGGDLNQLAPNHPLRTHPEWAVVYPVGTSGSRIYFDPGIPAARRYVEDSILDAVARYDLDGVHFDDFFYPYPEAGQTFNDAASFATYGKGFASLADWRRDNVDKLVQEMSQRIKALKPWVKFGISPFGIWRNSSTDPAGSATKGLQSYDDIYDDTRLWVTKGWLDYVVPQLYWQIGFDKADYATLVTWWSDLVAGTKVQLYIGHADYRVGEAGAWSDPAELDRQLTLDTHYNVSGDVHYSAKSIRNDVLGAVSRYVAAHYATPTLIPVMSQLPAAPPAAPVLTGVRHDSGATMVTWRPGAGAAATSFAIYRIGPTAQLVGTVRRSGDGEQTWVDHGPSAGRYCVAGLDRNWNEGPPSSIA